jgi:hypothetical protein
MELESVEVEVSDALEIDIAHDSSSVTELGV